MNHSLGIDFHVVYIPLLTIGLHRTLEVKLSALDSSAIICSAGSLIESELSLTKEKTHLQAIASHEHQQSLELHQQRFKRLSMALSSVNDYLEVTYRQLVPAGDCFVRYPRDPVSLFEEGLTVCARSLDKMVGDDVCVGRFRCEEGGRYWEARQLSGGQQAACGLAVRRFQCMRLLFMPSMHLHQCNRF